MHPQSSFVTLTYSPEHLPDPPQLVKSDLQKFWKRLRYELHTPIKYFACGEYGDQLSRPHYHAIIFGVNFGDRKLHSVANGINVYKSETLDRIWGLGFCTVGTATFDSAAYIARYSIKKVNGQKKKKHYERIDVTTGEIINLEPEFLCMSLKPAIGKGWFEHFSGDLFPDDFVVHNGKRLRVPAYYDKLLEAVDPSQLSAIKEKRQEQSKKHWKNQTPERLKVREEVKKAQLSRLTTRNLDDS